MEIIQEVFSTLMANPLVPVSVLATGAIVGFITRYFYFDKNTLFALFLVYAPFIIDRLIAFFLLAPPTASGAMGTTLFTIYLIAFLIGRKFGKAQIV